MEKQKERGTRLVGVEAIEKHYGRCWNVILRLIKEDNFPAIKNHGRWESDSELIDKYCKRQIEQTVTI